ncbi:hypothetical protein Tco_1080085 [Tanacetum coccineum]|uniref:Uncharacterized protein n=1 Tax=Tanacetum coccineum TaxID=301880 RepID=A0ABQ5HTP0_9ASTR
MVWSGYAVFMSGKTDSIKLNNIPGYLTGSTFVYSEVFKLDFSSASLHSALVTIYLSSIMQKISWHGYAVSFYMDTAYWLSEQLGQWVGGSSGGVWNDIVRNGEEIDGTRVEELLDVVENVVVNSNCMDKWRWILGEDGKFTIKELARLVEEKILRVESGGQETLWNKLVPKKVNIFV